MILDNPLIVSDQERRESESESKRRGRSTGEGQAAELRRFPESLQRPA